jgi:hypothetical protein
MKANKQGQFSNYVIPLSHLEDDFASTHEGALKEGRVPPGKAKETNLPVLVRGFIKFLWLPVFISSAPILAGIATFGWQVVKWARTGFWTPMPVLVAFRFLGLDHSSVYSPKDWYGLARVGRWLLELPLSLCLIMAGLILVILLVNACESLSNYLSSKYGFRNNY